MTASAEPRRNSFDGLTPVQHQTAMRKLAEVVDRSSRLLGQPTPEVAKKYLPAKRTG